MRLVPVIDLSCRWCFKCVKHHRFDLFVLFLILISSINLALDAPRTDPSSNLHTYLFHADVILAILFVIEAMIKIIATGLVAHKVAHLLHLLLFRFP